MTSSPKDLDKEPQTIFSGTSPTSADTAASTTTQPYFDTHADSNSPSPTTATTVTIGQPKFSTKVNSQGQTTFSVAKSQEGTRAKIAWVFTIFFLVMMFLAMVGPFVINLLSSSTFSDPVATSKNLTTNVASVLSGPFGFIVGFYFKQSLEDG